MTLYYYLKQVRDGIEESLKLLQTDYIDLMLIHSPHSFDGSGKDIIDVYQTLLELQKQGKIRSVGVSNFGIDHLKTLIETHKLQIPSVNQIECNPFCFDTELLNYCSKYNIKIEAYGAIFTGAKHKFRGYDDTAISCFDHDILRYIGDKYNKTSTQIMMRWSIQNGFIPITQSTKTKRNRDNVDIFDFELNEKEMLIIGLLNEGDKCRHNWNPMKNVKWDYKINVNRATSKL